MTSNLRDSSIRKPSGSNWLTLTWFIPSDGSLEPSPAPVFKYHMKTKCQIISFSCDILEKIDTCTISKATPTFIHMSPLSKILDPPLIPDTIFF